MAESYKHTNDSSKARLGAIVLTFLVGLFITIYWYCSESKADKWSELKVANTKTLRNSHKISPLVDDGRPPDFRNVKWGMNMEQVKAAESAHNIGQTGSNYLSGFVHVQGLYAQLGYTFENGYLVEAYLDFMGSSGLTYDAFIEDYATLNKGLIKKYGPPNSRRTIRPTNRTTGDEAIDLGRGYLKYVTTWRLKRTHIDHMMQKKLEISHSLIYTEKLYALKREKKAKSVDDL